MGRILQSAKGQFDYAGKKYDMYHCFAFQYIIGYVERVEGKKDLDVLNFIAFPVNQTPVIPRKGEIVILDKRYAVDSIMHTKTDMQDDSFLSYFVTIILQEIVD